MNPTTIVFDYFYGTEAQQFAFYRIPKLLVRDERFKMILNDAKLLYGLLLERMSMSQKNGWFDEKNRAYVIYTIDEIAEDLGIGREKAGKMLRALDTDKGVGLVERIRRGQGKPDILYVKNIAVPEEQISESQISENEVSANPDNSILDVRKSNANYNIQNEPEMNYPSIDLSTEVEIDGMDETAAYMELIRENIDYDHQMRYLPLGDKEIYEELYRLICEIVCVKRRTVQIGGERYPYELVKSRFLTLDRWHLEYVMACMKKTNSKIDNIKAYMLTALYNAAGTINHFYQQAVRRGVYGGIQTYYCRTKFVDILN